MAQLEKGRTFNPGDTVEAADLNLLVDGADALKGIISEQTQVPAATGDHILIVDASDSGNLKKALISSLPGAGTVTTVSVTQLSTEFSDVFNIDVLTPGTTPEIRFNFETQLRRLFLAAPVAATGRPVFRAIAPQDVDALVVVAAHTIDLDTGHTFWKSITANETFLLKNGSPGQVIKVIVQQSVAPGTKTVAWDTDAGADVVRWPSAYVTPPVMSTGPYATDIYEFTVLQVGGGVHNYYGVRWGKAFDEI